MGNAHRRSGRRAWAMLISAQDDAHGQCSPALRTTRVGNAPRGRAFSFVANPRSLLTGWTSPKGSACSTTRRSRRLPRCLGLSLFMSVPSFTAARRYSTNKQKRRVRTHVRTARSEPAEHLKHSDTRPYPTMVLHSAFISPHRTRQADSSTDKTHTHDTGRAPQTLRYLTMILSSALVSPHRTTG